MNGYLEEYIESRKELIRVIRKFPINLREKAFLGEWSLKDIIAHLTGWAEHQAKVLRDLINCVHIEYVGNIQEFNEKSVAKRKDQTWRKIYAEFIKVTAELITLYGDLPKKLWKKKIWQDKKYTPEKYIKIEIRHYIKTHIPQIQQVINNYVK